MNIHCIAITNIMYIYIHICKFLDSYPVMHVLKMGVVGCHEASAATVDPSESENGATTIPTNQKAHTDEFVLKNLIPMAIKEDRLEIAKQEEKLRKLLIQKHGLDNIDFVPCVCKSCQNLRKSREKNAMAVEANTSSSSCFNSSISCSSVETSSNSSSAT